MEIMHHVKMWYISFLPEYIENEFQGVFFTCVKICKCQPLERDDNEGTWSI